MGVIFAENAVVGGQVVPDVRISVRGGCIEAVEAGARPAPTDERHAFILPGMPNLHSHAFQRAMSGLAEVRGPAEDSFWSWRTVMYRFALALRPDQMEAVAAQAYMEMLEQGFSRVGEFHYLHHDRDGGAYANPAEMLEGIAAAAETTGIALTMLPVFYAHSGFGGAPPTDEQRRFICDLDGFARLMERAEQVVRRLPGCNLGLAPHSLRAVTEDELLALIDLTSGPVHIHVAEQVKEVEDCLAWSGLRPVEWLLSRAPVDHRWCFIHATHMVDSEIEAMGRAGAVAGLCPVTEANLGDGVFQASAFLGHGGRFGVGTDSNVSISVRGELQMLEYSQRLQQRKRNVIADAGQSTARRLVEQALEGGNRALQAAGGIDRGRPADLVSLDLAESACPTSSALDQWIFGTGIGVDSVWVGGKKLVSEGRHHRRDEIAARFRRVVRDLLAGTDEWSTSP